MATNDGPDSSHSDSTTATSTVPEPLLNIAVFVKRDLQAVVAANFLIPELCSRNATAEGEGSRQCRVLLLICDFVMQRERACQALRAHMALERDIFFDTIEPLLLQAQQVPKRVNCLFATSYWIPTTSSVLRTTCRCIIVVCFRLAKKRKLHSRPILPRRHHLVS